MANEVQRQAALERAGATFRPQSTPVGIPEIGDAAKFLSQYTTHPIQLPLTNETYRWVFPTLAVSLTTTTTSDVNEYKLPNTHHLLITKIQGHLAFNNPDGETLSITGLGNPSLRDRIALKAMNCRMKLINTARTGEQIFPNNDLALSTLIEAAGGGPIELPTPHFIHAGDTLEMTAALQDTAAAIVGGSTQYGVVVHGLLIRKSRG